MKDQFVPYESAVKLKELGFQERCLGIWYWRGDMFHPGEEEFYLRDTSYFAVPEHHILAPLWQQAFNWLREKYDINYQIIKSGEEYFYNLQEIKEDTSSYYKTYEEARQACLEELIKINLNIVK